MRKFALTLVLLVFSATSAMAAEPNQPSDHPVDWALHATGGFIISDVLERTTDWPKPLIYLTVLAVGVAKEATDENFDPADVAAWLPGVAIRIRF